MTKFSWEASYRDVMNRLIDPLTQGQREILASALEAAGRDASEVPVDGNGQSLRGLMRDPSPLVARNGRLLLTPLGVQVAIFLLDSGLVPEGGYRADSRPVREIAVNVEDKE